MWRMRGKKGTVPYERVEKEEKQKQTKDGHPRERKRETFTRKNISSLVTAYIKSSSNLSMDVSMYFTYSIVYILYQWSRGASEAEREIVRDREKEGNQKSIFPFFFIRYFLEVAGCVYVYIFHV